MICKLCRAGTAYGWFQRDNLYMPICPGCDWGLMNAGHLKFTDVKMFGGKRKPTPPIMPNPTKAV